MKVEIRQPIKPIDTMGTLEVVEIAEAENRQVFIHGKRVEKNAEQLILNLLDCLSGITGKNVKEVFGLWDYCRSTYHNKKGE